MNAAREAKPFTVIGGFLGAGKTTLVNHILAHSSGVRYALLVNDFGAINIDQQLINSHDGQTLALSNGCICCSMVNGFVNTMLDLMQQADQFDHIVVESSGVALPEKIMDFARIDPALYPEGIVVLADAADIEKRLSDPTIKEVVLAQLQAASLLLLNKVDTVSKRHLDKTRNVIQTLNPTAALLECENARVPVQMLFADSMVTDVQLPATSAVAKPFISHSVSTIHPLNRQAFELFRQDLPENVLRAKGLLHFNDEPDVALLWQRTGSQDNLRKWRGESTGESQVVIIASGEMARSIKTLNRLFE